MTSVLVCDDSPLAREALRRAVATVPGVERVTTAANGEEVLRRWGADRSDLILMDVRMPGLGGVGTVQRLLDADPGARIIILAVGQDPQRVVLAVAAAHGPGDPGARRHEQRPVQRGDRTRAVPLRGHGQDARAAAVQEARGLG